jgi:hypothetical protein
MPNEIRVVHLIVDPQLYSTKFNMNIVHITPQRTSKCENQNDQLQSNQ